jgi:hypothetical protein
MDNTEKLAILGTQDIGKSEYWKPQYPVDDIWGYKIHLISEWCLSVVMTIKTYYVDHQKSSLNKYRQNINMKLI